MSVLITGASGRLGRKRLLRECRRPENGWLGTELEILKKSDDSRDTGEQGVHAGNR